MIIHDQKQIVLMRVPRTGSKSLYEIFENIPVDVKVPDHFTYNDFVSRFPDKTHYRFFAFYRHPAEKFISTLRIFKAKQIEALLKTAEGKPADDPVHETVQNHIKRRTYELMYNNGYNIIPNMFAPQTKFYPPGDNLTLFNFENYESEVMRLLQEFDYVPSSIPIENEGHPLEPALLSPFLNYEIRRLYTVDYDFFDSKGIVFDREIYEKIVDARI